jgi:hypothetical protein
VGTCEYGDEPSGSLRCGEFLDSLRTRWLFRKNSAPWSWLVMALEAVMAVDVKVMVFFCVSLCNLLPVFIPQK